jgi:phage shock protein A
MIACGRWNEKPTAEKTWTQFKSYFAAAHRQHKQMQGESAATSGYHSANSAVTQNEDQMAEATIGALPKLATETAADKGVVAALTQANSRLTKQMEGNSGELRELKALLNQERRENGSKEVSTPQQAITVGLMATKLVALTRASLANSRNLGTKPRPLERITWEAVRPTENDFQGRQL